jgi:endoglucanase
MRTPRLLAAFCILAHAAPAAAAPAPPARKPWLSGDVRFHVEPNSNAARQAAQWKTARPADAALMEELARAPVSFWLCGGDPGAAAKMRLDQCRKQKALPVFVLYNIPDRDAGNFSKGGEASAETYLQWIGKFADAVGAEPAVAVFEPDALGLMDRCPEAKRAARYAMIASAIQALAKSGSIDVYVDAGNAGWLAPAEASKRLQQAGIDKARGFALNVSNFHRTEDSLEYGRKVAALVGGKHFVVDTSRNGNGPLPKEQDKDGMGWCNPPGRAVGHLPTAKTGEPLCDAFLWIKTPGESDGAFRGGPASGGWWPDYALELMKNAAANAPAKPKAGGR